MKERVDNNWADNIRRGNVNATKTEKKLAADLLDARAENAALMKELNEAKASLNNAIPALEEIAYQCDIGGHTEIAREALAAINEGVKG